jgi:hypothetical protein
MTNVITDACKNGMLDSAVAAALTGGVPALSLHTAFPPTTGNEVVGGSPAYARKGVSFAAASAGQKSISAAQTFDVPASTTIRAVALYDQIPVTGGGGTQKCWSPANASARRAFSVDATGVTNNDIFSPTHGLTTNDRVLVWPTIGAGLPTGLAEDTEYFVIATGLTTDSFRVSTSQGGAAVDITAIGDGDVQKYVAEVFSGQGTYQVSNFTVIFPG